MPESTKVTRSKQYLPVGGQDQLAPNSVPRTYLPQSNYNPNSGRFNKLFAGIFFLLVAIVAGVAAKVYWTSLGDANRASVVATRYFSNLSAHNYHDAALAMSVSPSDLASYETQSKSNADRFNEEYGTLKSCHMSEWFESSTAHKSVQMSLTYNIVGSKDTGIMSIDLEKVNGAWKVRNID